MSDLFQFRRLTAAPQASDTIRVYAAGTTDLVADLTDLVGAALPNPFTVADAGGTDAWGFTPPAGVPVDVYWSGASLFLAVGVNQPAATPAQGSRADSALQPDGDGSQLTGITPSQVAAATLAQGGRADTALQPEGNLWGLLGVYIGATSPPLLDFAAWNAAKTPGTYWAFIGVSAQSGAIPGIGALLGVAATFGSGSILGVGIAEGLSALIGVGMSMGAGVFTGVGTIPGTGLLTGVGMNTGTGEFTGNGLALGLAALAGIGMTVSTGTITGVGNTTGQTTLLGVGMSMGAGVFTGVGTIPGTGLLTGVGMNTGTGEFTGNVLALGLAALAGIGMTVSTGTITGVVETVIAHYKMDEATAPDPLVDTIGFGPKLAFSGGTCSVVAGLVDGKARSFANADSKYLSGSAVNLGLHTYPHWGVKIALKALYRVLPAGWTGSSYRTFLISSYETGVSNTFAGPFYLVLDQQINWNGAYSYTANPVIVGKVRDSAGDVSKFVTYPISLDKIYLVELRWNRGTMELWIDEVLVHSQVAVNSEESDYCSANTGCKLGLAGRTGPNFFDAGVNIIVDDVKFTTYAD